MSMQICASSSLSGLALAVVLIGCGSPQHSPNALLDAGQGQSTNGDQPMRTDSGNRLSAVAELNGTPKRKLLSELIDTLEKPIDAIVRGTNQTEYTVIYSALGLAGTRMDLGIALPCSSNPDLGASAETCLSDFGNMQSLAGLDGCFVSGCGDAVHWYIDTFLVKQPARHLNERSTVSYQLNSNLLPAGLVTYDPSPATHWEFEASANAIHSSVVLAASLNVVLQSGKIIDLSYTGSATGVSDMLYSYSIQLEFPKLLGAGESLRISIVNSSAALRSGTITIGPTAIAALNDEGLTWY
jgi:hypothetical protein